MKSICRTIQDPMSGQYQWERFTTKGIPDQCRHLSAFVCHYQLNIIPRGDPLGTDKLCMFKHTTDMVRVRGIGYQMSFVLQPKSGFRLQLIMFQTPYDMEQLSYGAPEQLSDNVPYFSTDASKQGVFRPNGRLLTEFQKEDDHYLSAVTTGYAEIFGQQKKLFDNQQAPALFQKMRINHPNVTVLMDRHVTVINHRTKPKTFGINRIVPSKTTWKYPTVQFDGEYKGFKQVEQIPNCKCNFMVIATPIFGLVIDPGQDMHGVELHEPPDMTDTGLLAVFQWEGSVVADEFGPPVAGLSTEPLETIDEDDGPRTRSSKGKEKERQTSVAPHPSQVPEVDRPHLTTDGLTEDAAYQMEAMVKALAFHCDTGKYERQKKAMEEAINPQTVNVDQYGWSKNATIMFRPTFRLWWAPMIYRKMVKMGRFFAGRSRHSIFGKRRY